MSGRGILRVRQTPLNVLASVWETEHGHVVEDDAEADPEPHNVHGLGHLQKIARERTNVSRYRWGGEDAFAGADQPCVV